MEFVLIALAAVIFASIFTASMLIRYVPNDRIGVIEKRFSSGGSIKAGLIALRGEAGFAPTVLRGGFHWLNRFQYHLHILPLVTITQGKIGYVFARDGAALEPTQTLASNKVARNFEDVAAFLRDGGQRGPQRAILREGTYAINLAQFAVITEERVYFLPLNREERAVFAEMSTVLTERGGFSPLVLEGSADVLGVVTVQDGPALSGEQIIAPIVGASSTATESYHNSFQDPEKFLAAGGRRGRQLQVLVEGTYYINRLFATIELVNKTVIEVGSVGVVVSYTGELGVDLSGTEYKHGELVRQGERGVWSEALLPGKYAFNTYAGKIIQVPTTNFILKWISAQVGSHRYDENLAEVSLITRDAFEPSLPLSVVVHIDYRKAPLVIQRFGDIRKLVEQTLDPMISAYFKNIAQTRTLIQLLQDRSAIQAQAGTEMRAKFEHYNLELEEVLIGTPASGKGDNKIETILGQLRQRQIAEEQIETYARQEKAAVKERELREAEARSRQQQAITESELSIQIQTNQGKAEYQRSLQEASRIKAMAEAEGSRIRTLSEAEAQRAARVGIGQAIAIEEQVRAYGGPQYQLTQQVMNRFAEAIQISRVDVVPKIVVGGGGVNGGTGTGGGSNGGNVMETLLTLLLSEKMGLSTGVTNQPRSAEVEAIRSGLMSTVRNDAASKA